MKETLLLLSILFLFGCNKIDKEVLKEEASIEKIANDQDYISFIAMNKKLSKQISTFETKVNYLYSKDKINEIELETISKSLGFTSTLDFISFQEKQKDLVIKIKNKFSNLDNKTQSEIIAIVKSVNEFIPKNNGSSNSVLIDELEEAAKNCSERLSNCNLSASVVYSAEILGCTGTAIVV
jgi:hypothetical protein